MARMMEEGGEQEAFLGRTELGSLCLGLGRADHLYL